MKTLGENAILTEFQKELLLRFARSPLRAQFYLTGGTALSAFYLGHRASEDLDFFSEEDFRVEQVIGFLKSLPRVAKVEYDRKFDRRLFLLSGPGGAVFKVEFTTYPYSRCEEGLEIDGIRVDSLKDILVNKIMALTDRRDPKDFVDLYFALKARPDMDLDVLIRATESKFGVAGVGYILRGRFLEGVPSIGTLIMLKELNRDLLEQFFKTQAKAWIAKSVREDA